jgi:phage gp36-like protein
MDPAGDPRRDLLPYIGQRSIELCLSDITAPPYDDQQAVVDKAIEDGESIAEGYCERHYTLPLDRAEPATNPPTDAPPEFLKAAGDIIAYNLWSIGAGPTEAATKRYDDAIKWLKSVARRETRIIGVPTSEVEAEAGYLIRSRWPREITPETMDF